MVHKYIPATTAAIALMLGQQDAHAQQPATTGELVQGAGMERVQVTGSRINLRQEQISGVGPVEQVRDAAFAALSA